MKDILDYDLVKTSVEKESKLITIVYYIYCLGASQHIIYSTISLISLKFSLLFFIVFQSLFILLSLFFTAIRLSKNLTRLSKVSLFCSVFMLTMLLFI